MCFLRRCGPIVTCAVAAFRHLQRAATTSPNDFFHPPTSQTLPDGTFLQFFDTCIDRRSLGLLVQCDRTLVGVE